MTAKRPMVIGHRGAPALHVEHTWASYRAALDWGVDAVEPDVVMTADGVVVVLHENELSMTTDIADRPEFATVRTVRDVDGVLRSGWFADDLTWEQLASLRRRERWPHLRPHTEGGEDERVLTLAELIDRLDSHGRGAQTTLVIELKHSAHLHERGLLLEKEVMRVLDGAPARQTIVEAFEAPALIRMREAGFGGEMAYLIETTDERRATLHDDEGLRDNDPFLPPLLRDVVTHLSVDKDLLLHQPDRTGDAVARLKDRGTGVFTWTLRPENVFLHPLHRTSAGDAAHGEHDVEWRRIWWADVDGVFVDDPSLVCRSLAASFPEEEHDA